MTLTGGGTILDQHRPKSGLSLLFAAGQRPSVDTIAAILSAGDAALPGAMISYRPPAEDGWVELLASGLTFELHGLAPAGSAPVNDRRHAFGFSALDAEAGEPGGAEAIALVPGPHIAGGSAMMPVVRTITGLAANLALSLPVLAVCWEPAESWMEPRYFIRAIIAWLAGGPFPVLGLTAVVRGDDGVVASAGLGFFSGQEVRVAPEPGEAPAETLKLAMRVIDNIVRRGPIERRTELDAPAGGLVIAEPTKDGSVVTVWRAR